MLGTLSNVEIIELTGRRHVEKQISALQSMGFRFKVRPDGTIAIARSHVEQEMGIVRSSATPYEPQLNL